MKAHEATPKETRSTQQKIESFEGYIHDAEAFEDTTAAGLGPQVRSRSAPNADPVAAGAAPRVHPTNTALTLAVRAVALDVAGDQYAAPAPVR